MRYREQTTKMYSSAVGRHLKFRPMQDEGRSNVIMLLARTCNLTQ